VTDFTASLERDPSNAVAYHRRGEVYLRAKKLREAVSDFDAAIRLDPDLAVAYCSRGWALARTGRPQEALIELTKVGARAQQETPFAAAFDARGRVWYAMGQYRKAVADYARVVELKPEGHDFARTWFGRGLAYVQLSDFEKAEKSFANAVELSPRFSLAKKLLDWVRSDRTAELPELRKPAKVVQPRTPPKSSAPVELSPDGGNAPPGEPLWDQWLVRTEQGLECGPVAMVELDQWCRQGRLEAATWLWRIDGDQWLPAGDIYPELVLQTHRSANRPIPIPISQVEEVEPAEEAEAAEGLQQGDSQFDFLGPKKGGDTPPDGEVGFPGIEV
jgi:tetratricopeptide (TPR) repeat protein